ncbi:hypothetical protein QVD17_15111 [Tagetes erecta]|uniref:Glucan endo-1,3-beta-D-glucosidase n=1 Tax=Tagetes erecta TaxID=13708 RepID=A0AAD8NZE4_TARER|nr:hypothetical protein QVD17_15111 [Tagetes erecta]
MAFNLLLFGIFLKFLIITDAQSVGVCNGRVGNNLPSPQAVVNLYRANGITRMRIYDPHAATLQALSGTNIELILDVPNSYLENLNNPTAATNWVRDNILSYPNVRFRYIAVGNEVDPNNPNTRRYVPFVLPAMRNVQNALRAVGNPLKVSTATYTGLLKVSYPPSDGVFHDNVVGFIRPIITFLAQNGSPMLANIYPYFAHVGPPKLSDLSFALFTRSTQAYNDNGRDYFNLFDAMYDAHYAAQARLGGANVGIVVSESGWPSGGGDAATRDVATLENAGTYYRNLIRHVKERRRIETYLFAMFDENMKHGKETEQHFGVFSPSQQSKYQLRF